MQNRLWAAVCVISIVGMALAAMGAVVLSILAAGPLAAGAARLGDWVGARTGPSESVPQVNPAAEMRRHTIVAGYGAVGRTVARVLQARGIPWVAIDADYPMVRGASQSGIPIIYGNAGTPSVLDVAQIDQASTVVFAMNDALAIRQGVNHALHRNERLHIVARAHSALRCSLSCRCGSYTASWNHRASSTSSGCGASADAASQCARHSFRCCRVW